VAINTDTDRAIPRSKDFITTYPLEKVIQDIQDTLTIAFFPKKLGQKGAISATGLGKKLGSFN
jgi:hypothetical protein